MIDETRAQLAQHYTNEALSGKNVIGLYFRYVNEALRELLLGVSHVIGTSLKWCTFSLSRPSLQ